MKKIFNLTLATLVLALLLISCNNDEDRNFAPPIISQVEIGSNNSKIAYAGLDLHFESKIVAEARIKSIVVQITPKNSSSGWILHEEYTEFNGQKNADLHKHYAIPERARQGEYEVLIVVRDLNGNKTQFSDVLHIQNNPDLPKLIQPKAVFEGEYLNVEANIEAKLGLSKITVELKGKTHTFESAEISGKTQYTFREKIDASYVKKGHYHPILTAFDIKGNKISYAFHADKK